MTTHADERAGGPIPAGAQVIDTQIMLKTTAHPDGVRTPLYAVLPPGARRGVVVLHEILGRQPEIDRVVQRFARAGYAAIAPDLFAHGSLFSCIRRAVQALHEGKGSQIEQIHAARRFLCALSPSPSPTAGPPVRACRHAVGTLRRPLHNVKSP